VDADLSGTGIKIIKLWGGKHHLVAYLGWGEKEAQGLNLYFQDLEFSREAQTAKVTENACHWGRRKPKGHCEW
jgi:hypothetical protein